MLRTRSKVASPFGQSSLLKITQLPTFGDIGKHFIAIQESLEKPQTLSEKPV
jgi:hypothetical protein